MTYVDLLLDRAKEKIVEISPVGGGVALYSCSFGSADAVNFWASTSHTQDDEAIEIYVFTNRQVEDVGRVRFIYINTDESNLSPRMLGKIFKTCPHKIFSGFNAAVYFDSNFVASKTITSEIRVIENKSIALALFKHNKRSTAIEELFYCYLFGKANLKQLLADMMWLIWRPGGWHGLFQGGFIYRSIVDKDVNSAMEEWLRVVLSRGERDQIYLPAILAKNRLVSKLHIIDGDIHHSMMGRVMHHSIPAFNKSGEFKRNDWFQKTLQFLYRKSR